MTLGQECKQFPALFGKMEKIREVVSQKMGVEAKKHQLDALYHLMDTTSGDLILNLPVGYGKSLIYQAFPFVYGALRGESTVVMTVVISPLNIIQNDQLTSLKEKCIPACRVSMDGSVECNMCQLKCSCSISDIIDGKFKIVFCHPESLFSSDRGQLLLQNSSFTKNVKAVFIDECHVYDKWHKDFRPDYKRLRELPAIFPACKLVGMSGTLTKVQLESLPQSFNFLNCKIISISPDRKNIFLEKKMKVKSTDVLYVYEDVFKEECLNLKSNVTSYPITIMYIPMFYMSCAIMFLRSLFGEQSIEESCYSAIFSNQDEHVVNFTLKELSKSTSKIRLVLSTSVSGMGFDPPFVTRVVHACPPRSLSQYLQEIGRAGRRGQASTVTLYYSKGDIANNVHGMSSEMRDYCNHDGCLREKLLSVFGFSIESCLTGCNCCIFCKHQCRCEMCTEESEVLSNLHL